MLFRSQDARSRLGQPVDGAEALRLAQALGQTLDQLHVEMVPPHRLAEIRGTLKEELQGHWQKSLDLFALLTEQWPRELAQRGVIDMADRRNRLLARVEKRWKDSPPPGFVVAAGIATNAPAVAALLRRVSRMERGQVVLAGLDQHMDDAEWAAIGPFPPDPVTGRAKRPHETHPQFALKLLLDRMDVARDDVALWRWGGGFDARAGRSRNISTAMLPPALTAKWRGLDTEERSLAGVDVLEVDTPAQEAQAVALALREAVETPERTAALVTPDRVLAARVAAHLRRWGIAADDSAGQAMSQLPPGTLLLALADAAAERFAPVALMALLKHPLVRRGEARAEWLEAVRSLDLLLRGPRPAADLAGIDRLLDPRPKGEKDHQADRREQVRGWWSGVRPELEAMEAAFAARGDLASLLASLRETASVLTGEGVWAGAQGHAAARLFGEMEAAAGLGPRNVDPQCLPQFIRHMLDGLSVRPPQGGHPRVAIFGLLEARLQQRDLMILSGLNEGVWPALPAPDPWLAPRIRQELGLPGLERRIGLSAHDFASGLGAPDVLVTRAKRDMSAPAIASRFWLRVKAVSGPQWANRERGGRRYGVWARGIDDAGAPVPATRPAPSPPVAERPGQVSVTEVDRLKADPFSFYARRVLKLSSLDAIDADPTAAWRGTLVHRILELWALHDGFDPAKLEARAEELLNEPGTHPLMRTLWKPRLMQAIAWIAQTVREDIAEGRRILEVECKGEAKFGGVTLTGTADRIDLLADGSIGIVDYKTGKPPSGKMVAAGYSLQLGLLGAIAQANGFEKLKRDPVARVFEYWSLGRSARTKELGYRESPVNPDGKYGRKTIDEFVEFSRGVFEEAVANWLTGDAPFTARLVPEIPSYGDYDQLMRLEEWYGRGDEGGAA